MPTVGIDIGGTKVMAGVVDADGNILEKVRTETPDKSKSPKVVEDTITELVLDLSDRHDVHAVGIGAAGWVDADRSRVLFAPHLAWRNEPLRDRLAGRLAVPGHGRQRRQHRRLGGVALRRRARRGPPRHDHARHRHRRRDPGGRPRSSAASSASPASSAICRSSPAATAARAATAAAGSSTAPATPWSARPGSWPPPTPRWRTGSSSTSAGNIGDITGPLITELAREGDAMCVELLQDIGQWLGVGIANLAAALDPSCFVIGGGVSAADDLLIGPARDAFRAPPHRPRLPARGPHRQGRSSAPRPAWSAPPTWPGWSPAASGAPTGAASSGTSATKRSRPPMTDTDLHLRATTGPPPARQPAGPRQ